MSSRMQRLTEQLVASGPVLVPMTEPGFVTVSQYVPAAAFAVIAVLTVRDWLVTRDRSRMYLALAIGSLAAVSVLGQVGRALGPSFAAASAYVTITIFLVSGLALLLFRHAVIPLKPRTIRAVVTIVIATGVLEIGVFAVFGNSAPRPIQLIAVAAFIVVWSGCVGEPSVRLWFAARRRTVVQRARMRALSLGYIGIVAILVAAVLTSPVATTPGVRAGFVLATFP